MSSNDINKESEVDNLIRLQDMYIEKALKLSSDAIVKGEYDAVSIHISVKKIHELFEQLKPNINNAKSNI